VPGKSTAAVTHGLLFWSTVTDDMLSFFSAATDGLLFWSTVTDDRMTVFSAATDGLLFWSTVTDDRMNVFSAATHELLFWSTVTDDMLNFFLESTFYPYFDAVAGFGAVKLVSGVRFYLQRVAQFGKAYSSDVTGDGPKRIKHWKAPLVPTRVVGQHVQRGLKKTREQVTTSPAGSDPPQRAPKRQCGGLGPSGGLDLPDGPRASPIGRARKRRAAKARKKESGLALQSLGGPRAKIAESRAIELARLIHADTSPLALKPHNEGVIVALCRASIAGAEASVASSTALKDDLAWTRWETYCLSMNTPAFRSDIRANAGIDYVGAQRESLLLVGFMIHCAAGYHL
jgi:hypothetical protein